MRHLKTYEERSSKYASTLIKVDDEKEFLKLKNFLYDNGVKVMRQIGMLQEPNKYPAYLFIPWGDEFFVVKTEHEHNIPAQVEKGSITLYDAEEFMSGNKLGLL